MYTKSSILSGSLPVSKANTETAELNKAPCSCGACNCGSTAAEALKTGRITQAKTSIQANETMRAHHYTDKLTNLHQPTQQLGIRQMADGSPVQRQNNANQLTKQNRQSGKLHKLLMMCTGLGYVTEKSLTGQSRNMHLCPAISMESKLRHVLRNGG